MARFLEALEIPAVTWLLTARRCLLAGVSVFPVVPPLAIAGRSPFPAVAGLTAVLRWNPLALDVSNALVETGAVTAAALRAWLVARGATRVTVLAHEDDVPALRLLVRWVWPRLGVAGRRLLAALAHLRTRAVVRADRIGLLGFSHGAAATSEVVTADHAAQTDTPPMIKMRKYQGMTLVSNGTPGKCGWPMGLTPFSPPVRLSRSIGRQPPISMVTSPMLRMATGMISPNASVIMAR